MKEKNEKVKMEKEKKRKEHERDVNCLEQCDLHKAN